MNILRSGASLPRILRPCRPQSLLRTRFPVPPVAGRAFHAGPALLGIRSQILKDVGEGGFHAEVAGLGVYGAIEC